VVSSRRRYSELVQALQRSGHRLTPQREAILRVFADTAQHFSAEQLYDQTRQRCRSTSRATVYNTVSVLKHLGEIDDLDFAILGHRYGAPSAVRHAHLVCTRCRRIEDFDSPELQTMLATVAAANGYRVAVCRLEFYGKCPACQTRGDQPR
jgi:Fur family transcriptional regulator, peroxide stress response regulator